MPHLASLALVATAVALAYANAPGPVLVFDARVLVSENPILRETSTAAVGWVFTHDYWQPMATAGLYRPLTMLSFLVDHAVFGYGGRATGYVVENVGIHLVCVGLVYALVWHLARRVWPATAAALLFAVHPVATEAVTNVVGRADLLATAGVVGGLLCWANGRSARGVRRAAWTFGLAVATFVALFSKESGLVLVPAVLLYDATLRPPGRRVRAEHLVVAGVLAAYLAARWWVDRIGLPPDDVSPIDNPLVEAPFLLGRLTAMGVLARELWLVVWPATLSVDYSYAQIPVVGWPPAAPGDWLAIAAVAGAPLALWALVRVRRRAPAVCFLGTFAAVALLPSANLLRLIGSIMAERFLYLPLVGLAGLAAVLADGWARTRGRRRVVGVALALLAVAAGARTIARNRDWRDERALWASAVRAVPSSAKAHKAYAAALAAGATTPAALADVVARAEQAVSIRPDYQPALVDLGSYDIMLGDALAPADPVAARGWYEKATTALESARTLDERATARFVEKMRARGHAEDTIPDVGDGVLFNNLALVYVKQERLEEALVAYRRMRALAPLEAALYRDIATIEGTLGRTDDAAVALLEAITIAEDDQEAKQRLVDLYRALPAGDTPIVTDQPDGEVQIHTSHPVVRGHRCRAWQELADIFTRARLHEQAARARAEASACASG